MSSPYSGFPGEDFFHPGFTPAGSTPAGTPDLSSRRLAGPTPEASARASSQNQQQKKQQQQQQQVSPPSSVNDEATIQSSHPSRPSPPPPALWPGTPHAHQDYVGSQLHGGRISFGQPVSPVSTSDGRFSTRSANRSNSLDHRVSRRTLPSRSRVNAPLPPLPPDDDTETSTQTHPPLSAAPQEKQRSQGSQGSQGQQPRDQGQPQQRQPQQQPQQDQQQQRSTQDSWPLGMGSSGHQSGDGQYQNGRSHWRPSSEQYPAAPGFRTSSQQQQPQQQPMAQVGAAPFMHYQAGSYGDRGIEAAKEDEYGDKLSGRSGSSGFTAPVWGGYRASWLPEIVWCLFSIVCLVIIGVILKLFDQQSVARWPMSITLNTLIAFLTTLCHAALVVPVVEGLSQLRWNWFAMTDRPLADFQAFEDATRGPYGSVKLLFTTTKGRFLSLTAAIVMVMGLVTFPLTQMAIEYPTRLTPSSSLATVSRSVSYPANNATVLSNDLDGRQKQGIQNGIFSPVDVALAHLPPSCGSVECHFKNFSSLAVCVQTADVTSLLNVSEPLRVSRLTSNLGLPSALQVRNASLGNGAFLIGSASSYNVNISSPSVSSSPSGNSWPSVAGTLSFSNQPNLLATAISNFFVIYTNQTSANGEVAHEFRAVEVLLHFCVNSYEVVVNAAQGGSLITTLTSSSVEVRSLSPPPADGTGTGTTNAPVLTLTTAADGRSGAYTVDSAHARVLSNYVGSALSGTYSVGLGAAAVGYTGAGDAFGSALFGSSSVAAASGRGGGAGNHDVAMRQAVQNITQNVATGLTNTIRSLGVAEAGEAFASETFVSVRWGWLAVLIVQVALSATFLAGVVVQTAVLNVRVLKSSALAAMFAVSAEQKRLLERERLRNSVGGLGGLGGLGGGPGGGPGGGGGADNVDVGHLMAEALTARGIRGRFCVLGEAGWVMDLGVRNDGP